MANNWWRLGAVVAVMLAFTLIIAGMRSVDGQTEPSSIQLDGPGPIPPIYALPPFTHADLRNPGAVDAAVRFLLTMQPEGTYVLSRTGSTTVAPMDVAHAAIALVAVGRLPAAEGAMTWLYHQMTLPTSPDSVDQTGINYSGSWYDDLRTDGSPEVGSPRGRGEGVGMALIATYSIARVDPGFLNVRIGDERVSDLVRLAAEYLTRPTMVRADGRFFHSPTYRVSFNEECARMTLGLDLAGRMLNGQGNVTVDQASLAASEGLRALDSGEGMSRGMAYDFFARSIWGLATPTQARQEVAWTRAAGLVGPGGVKNWDWQLRTASSPTTWLRWWVQARTVAPSQTFDYAIASIYAGDVSTAVRLERRWLALQRPDGGFDDGFVFGPFGAQVGFGDPTSYAVARFILFERVLGVVLAPK